jgi:hypothetical protein
MPHYSLGVVDFPVVGKDRMEDFEPPNPTDFTLDAKPRPITTEGDWADSAKMRNHIYGLCNGYEYVGNMQNAAVDLLQTSKDLPHIMPFPVMMDVFEEIAGRHEEEIEESLREVYRTAGTEKPSQDKIKSIATIPLGTNPDGSSKGRFFTPPKVFMLHLDTGYYRTVILPRLIRRYHRFLWAAFHGQKGIGGAGSVGSNALDENAPPLLPSMEDDGEGLVGGAMGKARRSLRPRRSLRLTPRQRPRPNPM